jgi:hypothetical protein
VSNTTHTNAGTYANDSWSFTPTANYNAIASTTVTDTIISVRGNHPLHHPLGQTLPLAQLTIRFHG